MWWIISIICGIFSFMMWCCLKVASDWDDVAEREVAEQFKRQEQKGHE